MTPSERYQVSDAVSPIDLVFLWSMALVPAATAVVINPLSIFYVYTLPKRRILFALTAIGALAFSAGAMRRGRIPSVPRGVWWPLLAYGVMMVVAAARSPHRWLTLWGWPQRYEGLIPGLVYLLVCGLTALAVRTAPRAFLVRWQTALVVAGILAGAYGIGQFFGIELLMSGPAPVKPYATFGNSVWLAAFMVLCVPVAFALHAAGTSAAERMLGIAGVTVTYLALLCSYTRSAWAAFGVAVVVTVLLGKSWRTTVKGTRVAAAIAVLAVCTVIFFWPHGPFERTLGPTLRRTDPTAIPGDIRQRVYIWRRTLSAIAARPLLGWGPDALRLRVERSDPDALAAFPDLQKVDAFYIDRAHNEVLQVAATTGLIGLAAYMWLVGGVVVTLWRSLLRTSQPLVAVSILAGAAGLLAAIQFQPTSLGVSAGLWSFLGVAAALASLPAPISGASSGLLSR